MRTDSESHAYIDFLRSLSPPWTRLKRAFRFSQKSENLYPFPNLTILIASTLLTIYELKHLQRFSQNNFLYKTTN